MSDARESLSRAQQFVVAVTIPSIAVLVRLTIALLASAFIGHSLRTELSALSVTVAMFLPFPVAVLAMVRAVARRSRAMEIAVLVLFSCVGALASYLWFWVVMPAGMDDFLLFGWTHFYLYAPATAVFLSLTAHFIAAIHQHRIAIAEDARRFEAEAEIARRARRSIERQVKPAMVVAVLRTVASRSMSDPEGAERMLLRLARDQRRLLQEPPGEVEPTSPAVRDDEDEHATPAVPLLSFVYPLLVYLIAVISFDLQGVMWWQPSWNSTVMTLASAACWLFAGPALDRAIRATVALRLPLAIATAAAGVLTAALFVTALSTYVVHAAGGVPVPRLLEWNVSIMAWRNSLPALVIGANALMTAYFGVMVAARAAAARALSETVRAETRALEDRFHPHFLFNALNSIVAFIREDRFAAARMCRQLSGLVERTVAFAGERWWAVENELDLIDEYLSIQRIRFGGRLEIDHWDIPADVRRRSIPRLILQPLLENIFKHAVAASARPIHAGLAIRKRGRGIEISLWNSLAVLAKPLSISEPPRSGRGLSFVSGRVRDAEGTLSVERATAGGRFAIRCYIPPPL